jgi:hypothetical protein
MYVNTLGVTPLDPLTLTSVAVGLGVMTMRAPATFPLGACWGSTRHGCFGRSRSLPRSAFLPSLSPFS